MIEKVELERAFDSIDAPWSPRVVAALNGQQVKIAQVTGEFVWHSHEHEDELFLVLAGQLTIRLRDGEVSLRQGELCVIPRGVEHCPVSTGGARLLLFEPEGTLNTGNVRDERTVDDPPWA